MKGRKILVTGVSGMVALPIATFLAADNEVWGMARLSDPEAREKVEKAGIHPIQFDLETGDFETLPGDIDHVLHLAYFRGGIDDIGRSLRINAEGLGLVLQHCRKARSALVFSSNGIYSPNDDPTFSAHETSPIGGAVTPWAPTASTAKIAQESVARFCARAFELPVTIARLNTIYGPDIRMLPVSHMDAIVNGRQITLRSDPNPHMPIHVTDVCAQIEALLDAASVPATIVNLGGDEEVSSQMWCEMVSRWSGKRADIVYRPVPGSGTGNRADTSKRMALTGPCSIRFEEGYRSIFESLYLKPDFTTERPT